MLSGARQCVGEMRLRRFFEPGLVGGAVAAATSAPAVSHGVRGRRMPGSGFLPAPAAQSREGREEKLGRDAQTAASLPRRTLDTGGWRWRSLLLLLLPVTQASRRALSCRRTDSSSRVLP